LLNISRFYRTEGYIKLTVGPDKVSWILNKELVCDRIPVLKKHIDASSSTPDCQIIHLKHDPVIFASMIDWVLTGKLDIPLQHEGGAEIDHGEDLELWCGIYDCSRKMEMDQLSQDVLEQIKVCLRCCKSPQAISHIFEQTPVGIQKMVTQGMVEEFATASEEKVISEVRKWREILSAHPELFEQFFIGVKGRMAIAEARKVDVRKRKSGHSSQPSQERLQRRALGNPDVPKVINLDLSERSRNGDSAL
jgi:hypothetical protein